MIMTSVTDLISSVKESVSDKRQQFKESNRLSRKSFRLKNKKVEKFEPVVYKESIRLNKNQAATYLDNLTELLAKVYPNQPIANAIHSTKSTIALGEFRVSNNTGFPSIPTILADIGELSKKATETSSAIESTLDNIGDSDELSNIDIENLIKGLENPLNGFGPDASATDLTAMIRPVVEDLADGSKCINYVNINEVNRWVLFTTVKNTYSKKQYDVKPFLSSKGETAVINGTGIGSVAAALIFSAPILPFIAIPAAIVATTAYKMKNEEYSIVDGIRHKLTAKKGLSPDTILDIAKTDIKMNNSDLKQKYELDYFSRDFLRFLSKDITNINHEPFLVKTDYDHINSLNEFEFIFSEDRNAGKLAKTFYNNFVMNQLMASFVFGKDLKSDEVRHSNTPFFNGGKFDDPTVSLVEFLYDEYSEKSSIDDFDNVLYKMTKKEKTRTSELIRESFHILKRDINITIPNEAYVDKLGKVYPSPIMWISDVLTINDKLSSTFDKNIKNSDDLDDELNNKIYTKAKKIIDLTHDMLDVNNYTFVKNQRNKKKFDLKRGKEQIESLDDINYSEVSKDVSSYLVKDVLYNSVSARKEFRDLVNDFMDEFQSLSTKALDYLYTSILNETEYSTVYGDKIKNVMSYCFGKLIEEPEVVKINEITNTVLPLKYSETTFLDEKILKFTEKVSNGSYLSILSNFENSNSENIDLDFVVNISVEAEQKFRKYNQNLNDLILSEDITQLPHLRDAIDKLILNLKDDENMDVENYKAIIENTFSGWSDNENTKKLQDSFISFLKSDDVEYCLKHFVDIADDIRNNNWVKASNTNYAFFNNMYFLVNPKQVDLDDPKKIYEKILGPKVYNYVTQPFSDDEDDNSALDVDLDNNLGNTTSIFKSLSDEEDYDRFRSAYINNTKVLRKLFKTDDDVRRSLLKEVITPAYMSNHLMPALNNNIISPKEIIGSIKDMIELKEIIGRYNSRVKLFKNNVQSQDRAGLCKVVSQAKMLDSLQKQFKNEFGTESNYTLCRDVQNWKNKIIEN
jgi:hypothetical protein